MDLVFLVDLLLMIASDKREDKQGMIQPLVLMTSPLIHVVLLLLLTEVSTRPVVKDFGFSMEGRTGHGGCMCHMLFFIKLVRCKAPACFDYHSP